MNKLIVLTLVSAALLAVVYSVPAQKHLNVKYSFISNLCGDNSNERLLDCCRRCNRVLAQNSDSDAKPVYLTCRKSGCSGKQNIDCACEECSVIPEGKENDAQYNPETAQCDIRSLKN
jgi:hypothetical protein